MGRALRQLVPVQAEIFFFICFLCDDAVRCLLNIVKWEHNLMSPILDLQVVISHQEDVGRSAGVT